MMSKTCHNVKNFVMMSKTRPDVKNFVITSKKCAFEDISKSFEDISKWAYLKISLRAYSDQRRTFFPSRFVRTRAFTPKQKNAGRRMNTSAVIGLDVITC